MLVYNEESTTGSDFSIFHLQFRDTLALSKQGLLHSGQERGAE